MKRHATLILVPVLAMFCVLPQSVSAQTAPVHYNGGLGFHSIDAPLGGRYWFGEQKVGVDFGLGLRSEPAPAADD